MKRTAGRRPRLAPPPLYLLHKSPHAPRRAHLFDIIGDLLPTPPSDVTEAEVGQRGAEPQPDETRPLA